MKLLHTSDWHLGKVLKGKLTRLNEFTLVMNTIVQLAAEHEVDGVLVSGDLFDTIQPKREADELVYQTLFRLGQIAPTFVIAGNHDSPYRWDALAGILSANRVYVAGVPVSQVDGATGGEDADLAADLAADLGVAVPGADLPADLGAVAALPAYHAPSVPLGQPSVTHTAHPHVHILTSKDGEQAAIGLLPFVHKSYAQTLETVGDTTRQDSQERRAYGHIVGQVGDALVEFMDPSMIGIMLAHVSTFNGKMGGGEREAHHLETYGVDPGMFADQLDYVALGHLHMPQTVQRSGPTVRYCGAPMNLDFGEHYRPEVTIVTVRPPTPGATPGTWERDTPRLRSYGLEGTTQLVTYTGTLAELTVHRPGQDWVRVKLSQEQPGDIHALKEHFGDQLVDIVVEQHKQDLPMLDLDSMRHHPAVLFKSYLEERELFSEPLYNAYTKALEAVNRGEEA